MSAGSVSSSQIQERSQWSDRGFHGAPATLPPLSCRRNPRAGSQPGPSFLGRNHFLCSRTQVPGARLPPCCLTDSSRQELSPRQELLRMISHSGTRWGTGTRQRSAPGSRALGRRCPWRSGHVGGQRRLLGRPQGRTPGGRCPRLPPEGTGLGPRTGTWEAQGGRGRAGAGQGPGGPSAALCSPGERSSPAPAPGTRCPYRTGPYRRLPGAGSPAPRRPPFGRGLWAHPARSRGRTAPYPSPLPGPGAGPGRASPPLPTRGGAAARPAAGGEAALLPVNGHNGPRPGLAPRYRPAPPRPQRDRARTEPNGPGRTRSEPSPAPPNPAGHPPAAAAAGPGPAPATCRARPRPAR